MKTYDHDELEKEFYDDDERQAIKQEAAVELVEMKLGELRKELGVTQEQLADRMKAAQPQLSKIENSRDLYLSTLERYVEALGGELEIHAVFNDEKSISINL